MKIEAGFSPMEQGATPVGRIGTLPDAPLAMPKQRLEPQGSGGRGLLVALLRPWFARTSRNGS